MQAPTTADLEPILAEILSASRIPGAALAVVRGDELVLADGFGWRDLTARAPMTADTIYPIASLSKALNATLLAMLVEAGKLSWDEPVQSYLPGFRCGDPWMSAQVTLRDLVVMRTGLPRHDWVWIDSDLSRAELVGRLRHLQLSAPFRDRFQYNNLTVTAAGHIAEVVTGMCWEDLVRERICDPLRMHATTFGRPRSGNVTLSYRENSRRELRESKRLRGEVTAPSGGAIHSTVRDMARWMSFNLSGGVAYGQRLIQAQSLAELHRPQMATGTDPSGPTPEATYGMGWFIDTYDGGARWSHGGYHHDVAGEMMLLPRRNLGIVACTNFGAPSLARHIALRVHEELTGLPAAQNVAEKMSQYERKIQETQRRNAQLAPIRPAPHSHGINEYCGTYVHPGYGALVVRRRQNGLMLLKADLELQLEHWHYDAWIVTDDEHFPIHKSHSFDRGNPMVFDTAADGSIEALRLALEPAVAPLRFIKQEPGNGRPGSSRNPNAWKKLL